MGSNEPEDRRLWCHQCAYGSTDPSCLFCGAPLTEPDSGVRLHEAKSYEDLRAEQRLLSGAMRRLVMGS